MNDADSATALEAAIARYNEAWNAHDLDAIMAMHAPDMVFENHTAGERAEGEAVRDHIGAIFETWPDIRFDGRRTYVPRRAGRPGVDRDRHARERDAPRRPGRRAHRQAVSWDGLDVIPFEDGLVKRKDVYSDSVSILAPSGCSSSAPAPSARARGRRRRAA